MAELAAKHIEHALAGGQPHYLVRLLVTTGSTPRDAGSMMMVGRDDVRGTIGGGSAEWVAILAARGFIEGAEFQPQQTITLGPEIDQCCGGTFEVSYAALTEDSGKLAMSELESNDAHNVYIFGAGHTGLALGDALLLLNMNVSIIDTRPEYSDRISAHNVQTLAMPEEAVRQAEAGGIYIITTHDHSLDFLITAEVLARGDAAYVGMIGSKTKRAVLKSWLKDNGYEPGSINALYCPIGGSTVRNKQPEIIAAMTVAEILGRIDSAN